MLKHSLLAQVKTDTSAGQISIFLNSNYDMKKIQRVPSFGKSCFSVKYLLLLTLNILAVCLVSLPGIAGEKTGTGYFQLLVTGKIVNESGTAVAGVSITEKGTNNVTTSKPDGSFSIIVAGEKSVLIISHIGFAQQEVAVGSNTSLSIRLVASTQAIDSVIVVGYGRQKKEKKST